MDVTKDRLAEAFASASLRIAVDRLSARDGDDYTEGHVRYPALAAEAVLRALALAAGPDAPAEDEIRADERRRCTRELRDYSDGLMHFAIGLVTAGDEAGGLPKVSRAAAIESAARLLEEAATAAGEAER
jgi:hypothetical protein